jgi:peptidoglycan/LPS O-acetylase OafA/YrhL
MQSETDRKDLVRADVRPEHWAVLAATRFFLAAVVVDAHYRYVLAPGQTHPASDLGIALGGGVAVIGFLVISGFSIAHSVQERRGFYARRIARIWPTLAISVALFAALIWTFHRPGRPDPDALAVAGTLLFLNGLAFPTWYGPTWSLSVEALYYALAPGLRRLSTPLVALIAAASALSHWNIARLGVTSYPDALHGLAPAGLFWAWGLGFVVYRERHNPLYGLALLAGGAALIRRFNPEGGAWWPATWTIAALAVAYGGRLRFEGPRLRAALNYLGDLSYPLFLLHMPVFFLMGRLGVRSWLLVLPLALAASVACLHLVDRPLRVHLARGLQHAWRRIAPRPKTAPALLREGGAE